jgi:glyoxylase-like metal-dependent hydrolase (beta-lactamase superfamily II)
MVATRIREEVLYEFGDRPEAGETMPVAPGIVWLRMPLPFALGHINLWLLREDNGWTIVDSGVFTEVTRNVWHKTFAGAMNDEPVRRVIATHLHPDHAGCAGWLTQKFGVDLWMPREEYLLCRILVADTGRPAPDAGIRFYKAAGFPPESMSQYQKMFGMFGRYVAPLPESYMRLKDGDTVRIGDGEGEVVIGRGHSPEHACLFCAELNVLISGDQLLPTISSNVSVYPTEPAANPLHDWIESLKAMKQRLPADVLVLPSHGKPFRGAQQRLQSLIDEHHDCLNDLETMCREPRRAVDVFPALFKGPINENNLIMATGESVAHLNYLLHAGRITVAADDERVKWYRAARTDQ